MQSSDDDREWAELQEAVDAHLDATRQAHLSILGIEYTRAMRSGRRLRELAELEPSTKLKSGRIVANPLYETADREVRRGISLAKALELHKPGPWREADPFAALDGITDLQQRRATRRAGINGNGKTGRNSSGRG